MPRLSILGLSIAVLLVAVSAGCDSTLPNPDSNPGFVAYVGTYTEGPFADGNSRGVYAFSYDPVAGAVTNIGLAAETRNPSWLVAHPNGRFLYAVNELSDFGGEPTGAISAFAIDAKTRRLTLLNSVSSGGADPCHLTVSPDGQWLFVANYTGGSIAVFPVRDDGSLGPAAQRIQHTQTATGPFTNAERQEAPHAHSVDLLADSGLLYVSDLGGDRVYLYDFDDAAGELAPHRPAFLTAAPGFGPRHIAFPPAGGWFYSLGEINSTVARFPATPGAEAAAYTEPVSTLPDGFAKANTAAEIAVHPSGRFLYASNRGHDSIAVFSIDQRDGSLTLKGHASTQGRTPRFFGIDPAGRHLLVANQDSGSVVVLAIDTETGALTPTGAAAQVPSPVSIVFVAADGS